MIKKINILTILLITILCIAPIVQSIPQLPSTIYGTLYIDGLPAPVGTVIEAVAEGIQNVNNGNPFTIVEEGKYQIAITGVSSGTNITFKINNEFQANQQYEFKGAGSISTLNLTISTNGAGTGAGGDTGAGGGGGGAGRIIDPIPSPAQVEINEYAQEHTNKESNLSTEKVLEPINKTENAYLSTVQQQDPNNMMVEQQDDVNEQENEEEENQVIPGFGVILTLFGIFAALYGLSINKKD